jgi:hypothetical protein
MHVPCVVGKQGSQRDEFNLVLPTAGKSSDLMVIRQQVNTIFKKELDINFC